MTRQLLAHACGVNFNCQDNASFHACQASLQNRCVACLASSRDGATEALSLHVCFALKLWYGMIVCMKSNTRRQVQHLSEMKSSIADNAEHGLTRSHCRLPLIHCVAMLTYPGSSLVWHQDQQAMCHCLAAIQNLTGPASINLSQDNQPWLKGSGEGREVEYL